jgi:hypothetical protein
MTAYRNLILYADRLIDRQTRLKDTFKIVKHDFRESAASSSSSSEHKTQHAFATGIAHAQRQIRELGRCDDFFLIFFSLFNFFFILAFTQSWNKSTFAHKRKNCKLIEWNCERVKFYKGFVHYNVRTRKRTTHRTSSQCTTCHCPYTTKLLVIFRCLFFIFTFFPDFC